jgi:hypothetical protein
MFGFDAIAALPISGLPVVVAPVPLQDNRGGIGGKKKRKQRHDDVEELVTNLPEPSVMADQMRAIMLPPMDRLPSLVQARKAQVDFEAEQDDEEILLLLM